MNKSRKNMITGLSRALEMLTRVMEVSSEKLGEFTGIGESGMTEIIEGKRLLTPCEYVSVCAIIDLLLKSNDIMERTVHAIIAVNMGDVNWVEIKTGNLVTRWVSTFEDNSQVCRIDPSSNLDNLDSNNVVKTDKEADVVANDEHMDIFEQLKANAISWKEV